MEEDFLSVKAMKEITKEKVDRFGYVKLLKHLCIKGKLKTSKKTITNTTQV